MKYFIILYCILFLLMVTCENNLLDNVKQKIAEEDNVAPVPGGNGLISITNQEPDSLTINWTKATDDISSQSSLEYKVVYSLSDNIDTLADAEENGTVARDWIKDIDTTTITSLDDLTTYYVNVLARDIGENNAIYTTASDDTAKLPRLYWTEVSTDKIVRAHLDGSNLESEESTGIYTSMGIAIDDQANKIYWTDNDNTADWIKRSDINGTNGTQETMVTGLNQPVGIEIDSANNNIYWADYLNKAIYKTTTTSINQGIPSPLISLTGNPGNIALDLEQEKIYWIEQDYSGTDDNDRIGIADLDGSNVTTFIDTGNTSPTAIEFDSVNNMIYWIQTSSGFESVKGTDRNITAIDTLFSGATYFEYAYGLTLDTSNGIMYWTDYGFSHIYYANMDGSGGISDFLLVSGSINNPYGIVIDY